jgi:hypothetical protein
MIVVLIVLLVAATIVRRLRDAARRRPPVASRPERSGLDPGKQVSATWSEISSEREGKEVD